MFNNKNYAHWIIIHVAENPNVGKHLEAASDKQKSSCSKKILSAAADVERASHVSFFFVITSICTEAGDAIYKVLLRKL